MVCYNTIKNVLMNNKKIAISGASGYIGKYLTSYFENLDYNIIPITRDILNDKNKQELRDILNEADIVINLAGESINRYWSESYKKKIYHSRIDTTRTIVESINFNTRKPELFISASAVGYYPSEGCYDEYSSAQGSGFLSQVCYQWEKEAQRISPEVRSVITRFGVVLSPEGGAFEKITLPVRIKLATIMGTGKQPFTWIDIQDLANAMRFITDNKSMSGVVNLVSVEQISNKEFTEIIAKHYNSWLRIKIPQFFFRILLGEVSQLITEGQCVYPAKLVEANFKFKSPSMILFLSGLPDHKKK